MEDRVVMRLVSYYWSSSSRSYSSAKTIEYMQLSLPQSMLLNDSDNLLPTNDPLEFVWGNPKHQLIDFVDCIPSSLGVNASLASLGHGKRYIFWDKQLRVSSPSCGFIFLTLLSTREPYVTKTVRSHSSANPHSCCNRFGLFFTLNVAMTRHQLGFQSWIWMCLAWDGSNPQSRSVCREIGCSTFIH